MRAIAFLFVFLLLGAVSVGAEADASSAPALFSGFQFGDPPREGMLCMAGPCSTGQQVIGHRNPNQLTAVYRLPKTESRLGQVAVSTPQYYFFQDQLSRVLFHLDCDAKNAEYCMDAAAETLNEYYDMTLVRETYSAPAPDMAWLTRLYRTAAGQEVKIERTMYSGVWSSPVVDFNDPTLMDQLRFAANPNFRPHAD
ncbi:MAG: hypothetical protein P8X63_12400 [Desulfuromonadaceae bacterium]|jgi:hypothetical protein